MAIRIALFSLALLSSAAIAQQPEAVPNDLRSSNPAELVAKMTGIDVAREFRSRPGPQSAGGLAAVELIELKEKAIPALSAAIKSDDVDIRRNAAYLLGFIQLPACIGPLIRAANDTNTTVRVAALGGLPAHGDPVARQTLIEALKDLNADVRNAAVWAFHQPIDGERPNNSIRFATANLLIPMLDDPATQYATAYVLGELDSNVACRPLLKLLDSEETAIQRVAIEALGKLKDKQVTMPLVAMLGNDDASLRGATARALGEIGDLRATPRLVSALSDEEPSVRGFAAWALGAIGDRRATRHLVLLSSDKEWTVRRNAVVALGQIADVRSVPSLIRSLKDSEQRVRYYAATSLGQIGDPRAIEPMADYALSVKHTSHADPAIESLRRMQHPDAVAALVKVTLGSSDQIVRHRSRGALGDKVGASFRFESDAKVKRWWEANRGDYERGLGDQP